MSSLQLELQGWCLAMLEEIIGEFVEGNFDNAPHSSKVFRLLATLLKYYHRFVLAIGRYIQNEVAKDFV